MLTAEKVYKEILEMPIKEREKLFAVIARKGFEKDSYTREEVFSDLRESPFTLKEAAEYLEVAQITLRRWVQASGIRHKKLGRNIIFDPMELKSFKKEKGVKEKITRAY
jgi:excisionase family DNA binding protein